MHGYGTLSAMGTARGQSENAVKYDAAVDLTVTLPDGTQLDGNGPIVIIGPNGSGKTRNARAIRSDPPPVFVNALRNTRVAPEIQAMGLDTARSNFDAHVTQSRHNHWELSAEFDFMLSRLMAEHSMVTNLYFERAREDLSSVGVPGQTPLTRVQEIWSQFFPGRKVTWDQWKPTIKSSVPGDEIQYSGNQMSDGEKAALYLAGRVFSTSSGVLVVDEPETHFHSLLAVQLWNALEAARPDIRFIYITHDLTFALSRINARYVLADSTGLRVVDLEDDLPADVAEALLGAASLSFYASRVIFCEGDATSYDSRFYQAWFSGVDTVIRPVGGCQAVLRCVTALRQSNIATSLNVGGIVDRDFHSDEFISALPDGVFALEVHEVETLFSLPDVVLAVCHHLSREFDLADYLQRVRATVNSKQQGVIATHRWKERIEPKLIGLVSSVGPNPDEATISDTFDQTKWSFNPTLILAEELERVKNAVQGSDMSTMFRIIPGKQLTPIAAAYAGMTKPGYVDLLLGALTSKDLDPLSALRDALISAWAGHLPVRADTGQPLKDAVATIN